MKAVIASVIAAVIASVITTWALNSGDESEPVVDMSLSEIDYDEILERLDPKEVTFSMEPEAAAWIRTGTGEAASEQKILSEAANSACFLTHVEISGIQGPQDSHACTITLDDFTGYWQVNATTGEGTQSELYCNARCVVWE